MQDIPPKKIPEDLFKSYTLNEQIKVVYRYFNESKTVKKKWSKDYIERFVSAAKKGQTGNYPNVDSMLYGLMDQFPIKGKSVLITGSFRPFYEGFCIAQGASEIVVSEYNVPETNEDRVSYIHVDDLTDEKFDVVLSISSFEHDGLGRYGDPLDPEGDLKAMNNARKRMKNDGFLILCVPIGQDCLVWNAHRVYGRIRLPILIKGFDCLWSSFDPQGEEDDFIDSKKMENHLMILKREILDAV
jgi:hypothetical protein